MANRLTYKVVFPNETLETHSLKDCKKNAISEWLERNPFDTIDVYRGKKLYSTFLVVKGKVVGVRW